MVLGKDVKLGEGCVVENATILEGTVLEARCVVRNCIVGWRNRVQEGVELDTVFSGEDVTFRKGVQLTEYTICPNKSVSESNPAVSNVILWRVCSHKQSTNKQSINKSTINESFIHSMNQQSMNHSFNQ